MKITKTSVLAICVCIAYASCVTKEKSSPKGPLLSIQQISALSNDQSMNGKLVSIEGYAGICNNSIFVTKNKKNKFSIYNDGFCQGDKLIDAKIQVTNGGMTIIGKKSRNYAEFPDSKNLSDETIIFETDDYQEIKNTKLKFSGTLIYDGSDYYLDNVTITK